MSQMNNSEIEVEGMGAVGEGESQVSMGSLYDFNKSGYASLDPMTEEEVRDSLRQCIADMQKDHIADVRYYLMLCAEKANYTVIRDLTKATASDNMVQELYECITNRGVVKSIEMDSVNYAIEVWIDTHGFAADDAETVMYLIFPYDAGIVEVE